MELNSTIEKHFRLTLPQKKALKKLKLKTIRDLLFHFPARHSDIAEIKQLKDVVPGETATVYGKILKPKTRKAFRKKIPMGEAELEDLNGDKIKIIWFNQAYMAKMVKAGQGVKLTGKVTQGKNGLYLANPELERSGYLPIDLHHSLFSDKDKKRGADNDNYLQPIYPEARGITSRWFYHSIKKIFASGILENIGDYIHSDILKRYNLPTLRTALVWIHTPKTEKDGIAARKRFAFEEVFFIQLTCQHDRVEYRKNKSFKIKLEKKELENFLSRFPFKATNAQKKTIDQILKDISGNYPMSRLLEGDVGSGKTLVAAVASYAVVNNYLRLSAFDPRLSASNLQVAYMAPTEILATQHFESFIEYFKHLNINIGLITSGGCKKFPSKVNPDGWTNISRTQLLKWVANGEIPILIGTHSLIQKTVKFKNLALVIIDEQHRFGVNQRRSLVRRLNADKMQTKRGSTHVKPQIDNGSNLLYKDLTYAIRRIAFDVKKELGLGHKEIIYQKALAEELKNNGIAFKQEVRIPVYYRNKKVGTYVPDFVIEDKIIVELKALPFTGAKEKKQLWNYLKGSDYKLALLVNFGHKDVTIDRVIYDNARSACSPHLQSASSPHESASSPHLLSMTATPIPRTLALTIFGDLDLSLIDEMPPGRKQVITEIVTPDKRGEAYEKIKEELAKRRQVYVICPRIDEPDPNKELALNVKSVKAEAKRLKKEVFKKEEIEILHSKMKKDEKESVMEEFTDGDIDILVSTSVIEVGVNVPNATVIVIEGAERFGLAQLHQLRGRVLRSEHQAYCYIFSDSKSQKTTERLRALKTAKNGFELSELDLELRGAGELTGAKQWGISDIGMEAIKNIRMVEAARTEAQNIVKKDPELQNHPELQQVLEERNLKIHLE